MNVTIVLDIDSISALTVTARMTKTTTKQKNLVVSVFYFSCDIRVPFSVVNFLVLFSINCWSGLVVVGISVDIYVTERLKGKGLV